MSLLSRIAFLVGVLALPALVSAAGRAAGHGAAAAQHTGTRPVVLVYAKAARNDPNAREWIWRARADGSHPRRLLRGEDPLVSPDGRTIAFDRTRQVSHAGTTWTVATLWLARSDGTHPRRIEETRFGFGPSVWSPDSRYFLAGDEGGLHLVDRTTNQATLLAATAPSSSSAIEDASFSPDSAAIAYDRIDQTGSDIFVLSLGGSAPVQLTHDHQSFSPLWGLSRIAYLRGRGFVDGELWLMDSDGSHNTRLTSTATGFYPAAWSEDGRGLLAANPAMHNGRLWAVEVPSGRARRLTPWTGDLFAQGLSRDGRQVYAAIGCGGTISPFGRLETIPFSGGKPRVIVRGPCRGSWSA